MRELLLVCLGGALGTGLRYLLSAAALRALGGAFPYGTVAVNLIGSFVLSMVMFLAIEKAAIHPGLRIVLTVGVLGGFTTFSAFSLETALMIERRQLAMAGGYVAASVALSVLALILGLMVARRAFGAAL